MLDLDPLSVAVLPVPVADTALHFTTAVQLVPVPPMFDADKPTKCSQSVRKLRKIAAASSAITMRIG
jgi:hypothetical protein